MWDEGVGIEEVGYIMFIFDMIRFFEMVSLVYMRKCWLNVLYCREVGVYVLRDEVRDGCCNCGRSYWRFSWCNLERGCCEIVSW